MKFVMEMIPPTVTAQERKVKMVRGKPVFYEGAALRDAREDLMGHLRPWRPPEPLQGALELEVMWMFPTKSHREGDWRVTRPDTDNLEKLLKDCMTRSGFWHDDSQVCREIVMKKWTRTSPGIRIAVNQID